MIDDKDLANLFDAADISKSNSAILAWELGIKKYSRLNTLLTNFMKQHFYLSLSDLHIIYHGEEEKLENTASFISAKAFILVGDTSVSYFFEHLYAAENIKHLLFSECHQEIIFPNLSSLEYRLESVSFKNSNFSYITASIQYLLNLKILDIDGCNYLTDLPDQILKLQDLRHIQISNCLGFKVLPVQIPRLKKLFCIHFIRLNNLIQLFEIEPNQLPELNTLDIVSCPKLTCLPNGLNYLETLDYLEIIDCASMQLRLNQFERLTSLTSLILKDCPKISTILLPSISYKKVNLHIQQCLLLDLSKLTLQQLENKNIRSHLSFNHQEFQNFNLFDKLPIVKINQEYTFYLSLELSGFKDSVKKLSPNLFQLTMLKKLCLTDFYNLTELSKEISKFNQLEHLELVKCQKIKVLPPEITELKHLRVLKIIRNRDLEILVDGIEQLSELRVLDLSHCQSLTILPESIGSLKKLTTLRLAGCSNLAILLTNVALLHQLECLHLSGCTKLNTLPTFKNLIQLRSLHLSGCRIQDLPHDISTLKHLEELYLSGCEQLKKLPQTLLNMRSLKKIYITNSGLVKHDKSFLDELVRKNKIELIDRNVV